jgi:hypothetical protein
VWRIRYQKVSDGKRPAAVGLSTGQAELTGRPPTLGAVPWVTFKAKSIAYGTLAATETASDRPARTVTVVGDDGPKLEC